MLVAGRGMVRLRPRWRRRGPVRLDVGLDAGHFLLHRRDQLAPIVARIGQRVEAADQDFSIPSVIVEDRLGHLIGRAHQRGGIAARARQLRDLGPQALVDHAALRGGFQQALRSAILRRAGAITPPEDGRALGLQRLGLAQNVFGLRPCLGLGGGDDRAHRQAEAQRLCATGGLGGCADAGELIARARQRSAHSI
jgi:hypothetical protein